MSAAEGFARLAGLAGMIFGWTPDVFWAATPDELAAMLRAAAAGEPPGGGVDRATIARLQEQFPDG
ncbi:MAG: phage tail assembly chaperone [Pseudomonadota bacterium]